MWRPDGLIVKLVGHGGSATPKADASIAVSERAHELARDIDAHEVIDCKRRSECPLEANEVRSNRIALNPWFSDNNDNPLALTCDHIPVKLTAEPQRRPRHGAGRIFRKSKISSAKAGTAMELG